MFKVSRFQGTNEISYHEHRNLKARESNPRSSNVLKAFLLSGVIDSKKLQQALHDLVLRHEALRTRFVKDDAGNYVREISKTADVIVVHQDLANVEPHDKAVDEYLKQIIYEGFGPEAYPLMKVHVLTTSKQTIFILLISEVIVDAISVSLLLRELHALYLKQIAGTQADLAPLDYQLSDFVASHNAWMKTQEYKNSLQQISDKLHKRIEIDSGREQVFFARKSSDSYSLEKYFSGEFGKKIFSLAEALKVSAPTVVMVVSAICVGRIRKLNGIFLTSSFSNRHLPGLGNMLAHLATTVPSYISPCAESISFADVKNMHREIFASMAQYGMIPMQEISNEVAQFYPDRPAGTNVKFGRVVTDISLVDDYWLFGMETHTYPSDSVRAEANEFKFVYRILPTGEIWLRLRGLKETDNDLVASNIVDHLFQETLESLSVS